MKRKIPEEEFNPLSLKGVVIICLCLVLLFMAIYFFMSAFHLVNNKYSHDDCGWWEYDPCYSIVMKDKTITLEECHNILSIKCELEK